MVEVMDLSGTWGVGVVFDFDKKVVHAVLLYGLETWVLTSRIERILGRFHHRVAQTLPG